MNAHTHSNIYTHVHKHTHPHTRYLQCKHSLQNENDGWGDLNKRTREWKGSEGIEQRKKERQNGTMWRERERERKKARARET